MHLLSIVLGLPFITGKVKARFMQGKQPSWLLVERGRLVWSLDLSCYASVLFPELDMPSACPSFNVSACVRLAYVSPRRHPDCVAMEVGQHVGRSRRGGIPRNDAAFHVESLGS